MQAGDLVRVTHTTTAGGRVRRVVKLGETGILVKTHYINDLRMTSLVWCDVILSDGLITLPSWCIQQADTEDEAG